MEDNIIIENSEKEFEPLSKKEKILLFIKENLFFTLIIIACLIFIFNFRVIRVSGNSMDTTLADKQIHLAKLTKNITYNDIIVANSDLLDCIIIKRVIACPGDTIKIENNEFYLNGEKLDEPYILEKMDTPDINDYTLKENEYFCCGDNRNNSTDSRAIGPIQIDTIVGKMLF